ncbi:hypothetical protein QBC33DRAFT_551359 [Phialemonium atrogriseum]|uniref:Uncharacterized protein n=1 Tax=Phialemonium atrogriseum TaxID=1093897 RepID=A0AAJ0BR67_9PEZI|nr:uncharacterized protein QBC33DRAFT_551359 [Phialemonium atrogriseum]KAK1762730.1 hypothetical protein QBC33DRAFT_551359 [Phialemonium atrogriseum]
MYATVGNVFGGGGPEVSIILWAMWLMAFAASLKVTAFHPSLGSAERGIMIQGREGSFLARSSMMSTINLRP